VSAFPLSRRAVFAIWFVVFAALGVLATNARFTNDLRSMLPGSDPKFVRELDFFTEQGAARILAIEGWPQNDSVSAVEVHRALEETLIAAEPFGAHARRSGTPDAMAKLGNIAYDYLPELTTEATLQALLPQMTQAALSERLAALKIRASDPQDSFVATVARRDLLALSAVPVQLMAFGPRGTQQQGMITTHPDGKHALISMDVDFEPANISRTNPLMEAIDAHVAEAATRGVHLEVIGGYRHFRDNIRTVKHDLFASLPLCTLLIAVMLTSLFRNLRATLVLHAPALFGMLGAIGAIVIAGRELPIPMLGFAACVLGVAVDYATHKIVALRAHEDIRKPLVMSYITTSSAFAILIYSDVPAMQCIGLLVIGGLTLSLLSTLFLLPYLVPTSLTTGIQRDPWEPFSGRVLRWCGQHHRLNLIVATVLTIGLLPGLWQLQVVQDLRRLDGSQPGAWEALDSFMERWGKLESSDYLVQPGPTLNDALDKLAQSRDQLGLPPTMVEILLPSRAEQQRRRAIWNNFWTTHGTTFADNLAAACA
jgi:predicted exporter